MRLPDIHILSKKEFEDAVKACGLDDANVEQNGRRMAFICICDTRHPESGWGSEPYFQRDHANVLRLWFDDVEQDTTVLVGMVEHTARLIQELDAAALIAFLDAQQERGVAAFFVHCLAGISRSGAIGAFISDCFGGDYLELKQKNPQIQPNAAVLAALRKVQGATRQQI